MPFILTGSSVVKCPHGGIVNHISRSKRQIFLHNEIIWMKSDMYLIFGCPQNCRQVFWLTASSSLFIDGDPILNHISYGATKFGSEHQGVTQIISYQTKETEESFAAKFKKK